MFEKQKAKLMLTMNALANSFFGETRSRKGMQQISALAITLGVTVIVLSAMSLVNAQLRTQVEASGNNTYAYNMTTHGFTGLTTFGTWLPLIALVAIAAYVIGLLLGVFGGGKKNL